MLEAECRQAARKSIEHDLEVTRDFTRGQGPQLMGHALILVLSVGAMLALRPRAQRWAAEDETAEASARVLARPYAAGVVVAVLASPFLYPKAPSYFEALLLLVALGATLRLIPPLLAPGTRAAFYALAGFFVVDLLRDFLVGLPILVRLLFELELTAAIAVLLFLLGSQRLAMLPSAARLMPVFVLLRRAAIGLLMVALGGSALGFVSLSRLLGDGVLDSAYFGVTFYAAQRALSGMIGITLRAGVLRRLKLIRDHRPLIARRLFTGMRLAAFAAWSYLTLGFFGIWDPLVSVLTSVLSASVSVGELEIALRDLVAFAVTLTVAIYLARFLRYLLDEDVLPRLPLPRGIDLAVSTTVFYLVLIFGFFAALAASGFDLGRFALLAGALGVGIGFGLQSVVNNFVSGLILLYERRILTGNTIEIGGLFGEVRRIGIRSSTVRTWEGAEVIVPNADLVSDQVINWTLSDRQRRIHVNVGVRYGTDPEQVIELLLDVARDDENVLEHPEPSALFIEFGDSSLNFQLRAWTARFVQFPQIRSDLTVAINRRLADAEIEIPFPQRDLHVRSVADEARAPLSEGEETEPAPPRAVDR